MQMFRRLFIAAASAGLLSGLFIAVVHLVTTVPVIHQAEPYEQAADAQEPAQTAMPGMSTAVSEDGHDHDHQAAWEPQDGFERTAYTVLADVLTGIGFSLLLVAAYAVAGGKMDWRRGFYWGLAGFAAFALAPGLGLPPELPGTASAALTERQIWWVATALLTAGALALLFYVKQAKLLWYLVAVAMLIAPHLMGAPQPSEYSSAAPESLEHRFIALTAVALLLSWLSAGVLSGYFYGRFVRES